MTIGYTPPVGYCIQLVHARGGSFTILGSSKDDARSRASRQCIAFPGAYIVATLPFPVWFGRLGAPDCSIPREWREGLGDFVVNRYQDDERAEASR
jgi:hypothetical protein